VTLIVLVAAALLFSGAGNSGTSRPAHAEFQRLTGGLGVGAAVSPQPCAAGLNPSASEGCTFATSPVAGGLAYCPIHAGPSLRR